jgi:hypothetical protein
MENMIVCGICNESKPLDKFNKRNLSTCIRCNNQRYKSYKNQWEKNKRAKDRLIREELKLIKKQEKDKERELKRVQRENVRLEKKRLHDEKMEKNRLERLRIREEFMKTDEYKEQLRLRKEKERIRSRNKWNRRMENDPLFKLRKILGNNIRRCFRNKGFSKSSRTQQILGDDWDVIKKYFEKLFVDGMCWENYGLWHIDHILPISTATCEEDVIRLNHYTNLRPLWAEDNINKSDVITYEGRIKQNQPYNDISHLL